MYMVWKGTFELAARARNGFVLIFLHKGHRDGPGCFDSS